MNEFKQYRRKGLAEMRPYVPGEDLSGVSVSEGDDPMNDLGMIARKTPKITTINGMLPKSILKLALSQLAHNSRFHTDPLHRHWQHSYPGAFISAGARIKP